MIVEDTYSDLVRKQASITRLFPTFWDRVEDVKSSGGVRLDSMPRPDLWKFKVHSGTGSGWYDVYLRFVNIPEVIDKYVKDIRNWTKDKSKVDLRKLAQQVLDNADVQVTCSCPADLYWGKHYIRTKRGSKYTEPEKRYPDERNPRLYGAYCKHIAALMDVLHTYGSTMAKHLNRYFRREIAQAEDEFRKERRGLQRAATLLKSEAENNESKFHRCAGDMVVECTDYDFIVEGYV